MYRVMQAALPQGIVPFVFAKEYNIHPAILSTGYQIVPLYFNKCNFSETIYILKLDFLSVCRVVFGLLIAVPIALAYYFLLAL